jgi:hypothetical protein
VRADHKVLMEVAYISALIVDDPQGSFWLPLQSSPNILIKYYYYINYLSNLKLLNNIIKLTTILSEGKNGSFSTDNKKFISLNK